jgi:hypothetical protein
MPKVTVVAQLGRIDVGSQLAGAPDEHTIAVIHCRMIGVGKPLDTFVWVKQTTGSQFDDADNLEVSRPSIASSDQARRRGRSPSITARSSCHARSKTGPINAACSWISFGPANPWKMPSSNRLTDGSETSV